MMKRCLSALLVVVLAWACDAAESASASQDGTSDPDSQIAEEADSAAVADIGADTVTLADTETVADTDIVTDTDSVTDTVMDTVMDTATDIETVAEAGSDTAMDAVAETTADADFNDLPEVVADSGDEVETGPTGCQSAVQCPAPSALCQVAVCESGGTCAVALADEGSACTDGNACTQGDLCVAGQCAGKPLACDDANPCTTDGCDAGTCSHVPLAAGTVCAAGQVCWQGECVAYEKTAVTVWQDKLGCTTPQTWPLGEPGEWGANLVTCALVVSTMSFGTTDLSTTSVAIPVPAGSSMLLSVSSLCRTLVQYWAGDFYADGATGKCLVEVISEGKVIATGEVAAAKAGYAPPAASPVTTTVAFAAPPSASVQIRLRAHHEAYPYGAALGMNVYPLQSWEVGSLVLQSLPPVLGGCQTDKACDDANVCTLDTCVAGVCKHAAAGDGEPCGEGKLAPNPDCLGGYSCSAGYCMVYSVQASSNCVLTNGCAGFCKEISGKLTCDSVWSTMCQATPSPQCKQAFVGCTASGTCIYSDPKCPY